METRQTDNIILKENVEKLLAIGTSTGSEEDLSRILHKYQDYNQPKLTIRLFFEFLKLAYEVNNNCKNLVTILNKGNHFEWNNDVMQKNKSDNILEQVLSQAHDIGLENPMQHSQSSDVQSEDEHTNSYSKNLEDVSEKCHNSSLNTKDEQNLESVDVTEHFLVTLIKTNLSDVLHEGLLDTVLPYMIPKPTISQPVIKKLHTSSEIKRSNSLSNNIDIRAITNITHKEKEKDKCKGSKRASEHEVEIHVCDEEKNIKKNFHCPQKLLVQKMRYFADVTAGQRLEEIDISVHCDIAIFDWLMRWVKKDIIKKSEWPTLETNNVIPIMVSASFLQMEPLLENCIQYCHKHMSEILKTSTVLNGLDDNLLTRLVEQFTNEDVEALRDKKDKIQSKLFCKLITSLAEVLPDNKKGHYGSLATLFKCSKCGKHIIQSISNYVPCIPSAMKIDNHGNIHSKHIRDLSWNLNDYIVTLQMELHSWRKVYWRLWGDCHFLYCTQCNVYFPIHQFDWCCYHTELPQFFVNEQQRPVPFPIGRYPCCSQRAYKFEVLPNHEGCRYREHIPDIRTQKDINVLNIFTTHREVIIIEPPQLYFPERITRLVARDATLHPEKLICKDIMWWFGVELVPQRTKLGLLGKIWSSPGLRRLSQMQDIQRTSQRIRQQVSINTDTSSVTSSATESDADDGITTCENSSIGEESNQSEESHAWSSLQSKDRAKKKLSNPVVWRANGRSWSGNLNVRHNQDNQREFEESAAVQMITLLTKRVSVDPSPLIKTSIKHNRTKKQLNGGTYMRLEAELRDQLIQSYKGKGISGKYFLRTKLNKA